MIFEHTNNIRRLARVGDFVGLAQYVAAHHGGSLMPTSIIPAAFALACGEGHGGLVRWTDAIIQRRFRDNPTSKTARSAVAARVDRLKLYLGQNTPGGLFNAITAFSAEPSPPVSRSSLYILGLFSLGLIHASENEANLWMWTGYDKSAYPALADEPMLAYALDLLNVADEQPAEIHG